MYTGSWLFIFILDTRSLWLTSVLLLWWFPLNWMCSAFVSSSILWKSRGTRDFIVSVSVAFGFIITFVVYIRIYLTIQRHKNQIYSLQVQVVAQSNDMKKFAVLVKSILGMFYAYLVFLICYLPFFICTAFVGIYGSSVLLKKSFLFPLTLMLLNSSLNPVIYFWKMRHIRHAIMEMLRNISQRRNRLPRLIHIQSTSVVHVEN